jgi:acetolactate decarboxylase
MPIVTAEIPTSVKAALDTEVARIKGSASSVISAALAQYFGTPIHTLFQVSTSDALVAGVYSGVVNVKTVLNHGDFGLGTFANLDGEMVILDGRVYQVQGSGRVSEAHPNADAPFAVVTHFSPEVDVQIGPVESLRELASRCDAERLSGNIFYAFRLDGWFNAIRTRATNPPVDGNRLIDAAKVRSEIHFKNLAGTLVGLWSPGFSSAFSVSGYHFHFLSEERYHGGHLLECAAGPLRLRMEALTNFHLALPEIENFLKADLGRRWLE